MDEGTEGAQARTQSLNPPTGRWGKRRDLDETGLGISAALTSRVHGDANPREVAGADDGYSSSDTRSKYEEAVVQNGGLERVVEVVHWGEDDEEIDQAELGFHQSYLDR